ncbi:MAG TPA: isopentenyl-diphosphate Delta-isomerase [Salinivirgaceae bacterium]|nr:isopentenyl-diphosphate Delta-isomerase [Salinivirgaceae bacterium]
MEEKVVLVDNHDNTLGESEKMYAHKHALLHRAVSVFVFTAEKKMLLQQRALTKYHSPGLWTNAACTHPTIAETPQMAAIRRLEQEMGIKSNNLQKLFDFTYKAPFDNNRTEHEFDHVFLCISNQTPTPNPMEVHDFKYLTMKEILSDIRQNPQNYTVWFRIIMEQHADKFNGLMQ